MDDFTTTCSQTDAEFDAVIIAPSKHEPEPIMLIRAAARMIMTSYPRHRQRDMAMTDLISSVKHLHAMDPVHE